MKKLLSIVLILAALFGLVAGFMDMGDALSCKSYWEQKGEESDANLAKLSDGLTTLKDNKQAYTDGLVTVEEGEASLAEGKKTYEEGLATYNAGIEEYNAKTDEYNAGMEQLQGGRGKVIEAKDKLSAYTQDEKDDAKTAMSTPAGQGAYAAVNNIAKGSTDEAVVGAAAMSVFCTNNSVAPAAVQAALANCAAWEAGGATPSETDITIATGFNKTVGAYKAGLLVSGMNAYDQGLMDYYTAKGTLAWAEKKLAAAKEQLAAAKEELDAGKKTIDEGEARLAEGKAALKEYEDGMAQVKDGLKQVIDTKPDAGLTSIADRLGAGFSYMDGEELNIDKGFEVVDAAKEYSGENGALVTKEIASRIIGAILVLVAGVLAAIAGVIGLIKSGKISGLLSIVSVAAVVVGVALSMLAGSVMSKIAGSNGSMLMVIAGGILAVAGLVYGIVAMAGKKPAEVKTA